MLGKYQNAAMFQSYELVDALPGPSCGDWGYLPADLDGSCQVDLGDFCDVRGHMMQCTDPAVPGCYAY